MDMTVIIMMVTGMGDATPKTNFNTIHWFDNLSNSSLNHTYSVVFTSQFYDFLLVLLRRARKARSLRTTARTTRSRMLRVKSSCNKI